MNLFKTCWDDFTKPKPSVIESPKSPKPPKLPIYHKIDPESLKKIRLTEEELLIGRKSLLRLSKVLVVQPLMNVV